MSWKHVVLKLAPDNSPVYNSARVGRGSHFYPHHHHHHHPNLPGGHSLLVCFNLSILPPSPSRYFSEREFRRGWEERVERRRAGLSDTPNLFQKWLRVTNEPSPLCLMSPLSPDCNHCLSFRSLNFQTTEHKNQIQEAGARLVLLSSLSVLC